MWLKPKWRSNHDSYHPSESSYQSGLLVEDPDHASWSRSGKVCCSSRLKPVIKTDKSVLRERRRSWLTDALTAFCCATFFLCRVTVRHRSPTPLSQENLSDSVIWSVTQPPSNPEPSYPNSISEQGEEIEFPPSKTGLQIPINRSLESLQSIKFHLPRWSSQSGSSACSQCISKHMPMHKHVRMHEGKIKRAMHAFQLTNSTDISAIKQIEKKTYANIEVCPSS